MSIPFFLPPISYAPELELESPVTLEQLCTLAGVPCRASGAWTKRKVEVLNGPSLVIRSEPGDWGNVRIEMPLTSKEDDARNTLLILAYSLHDLVAKQSIMGTTWARPNPPRGRPKQGAVLSNRERQRRFRQKKRKGSSG